MSMLRWWVVAGVAVVAVAGVVGLLVRRSRSRQPQTVQEHLASARKTSAVIRKDAAKTHRARGRPLERGEAGGDRYSAAIFENSFYSDLSGDFGGGGDGGGGGGGGD